MPKISDLAGQRFGKLVVISKTDLRRRRYVVWKCICDCGNICYVPSSYLHDGRTKSCGCSAIKDLSGMRFGKLTVLCDTGRRTPRGGTIWQCRCDCGNITNVIQWNLTTGGTKSCGCSRTNKKSC